MTRVRIRLSRFIGALIGVGGAAFLVFRPNLDSLFSIRGIVILCLVCLVAALAASVRAGTSVRLPFRVLGGLLALASAAASVLVAYLFFSSASAPISTLLIALVFALFGAASGYSAISGRSPYWFFRKRRRNAA